MGGLTTRQLASRRLRESKAPRGGQLEPGDLLQDRYRIVGTLGVGGFSSVYQARDMRFSNVTKLCAVKEMVNMAPDPKVRELTNKTFEREANILATLDHPAVVDVYDYFSETDRSYLVLEFIRGKDMESMLAEQREFVPQETVLDWAMQICDVLAYLHNHKPHPVIFRDMKPSNIMLDPHGRIRLIDFGIAKLFQSEEKNTTIGTEGYAPPEQYRGDASPAGDVYGLGATLHHLLTRQDPRLEPPFSFPERLIHTVNPSVAPAFESIVMRCVSYNVEDRYENASALKRALENLIASNGVPEKPRILRPEPGAAPAPTQEAPRPGATPARTKATVRDEPTVTPLWTFKCEDEIRSKPDGAAGTVFVGAYDNNLYALNAKDGEFLWKFPASAGIASSPYFYKEAIFISSADNHLYCVRSVNGNLNWRFEAGGPIYSSPRAKFDHVFFGSDDGFLYAVNVTTGRMAWKAEAHGPIRSSPHIAEERVFFGVENGHVFCVDLSGKTKWQFEARRAVTSTPTVAQDMVFVGSLDHTVYALDIASGWAIWRFRTQRPIISSPVVEEDILYIGSADGSLYAIDINSGRERWSYETEGQVASSPAVWNDAVYVGSTDGYVYSLDRKRGKLRWRFATGAMVISSPKIMDGIVYIGSADHHLYALPG